MSQHKLTYSALGCIISLVVYNVGKNIYDSIVETLSAVAKMSILGFERYDEVTFSALCCILAFIAYNVGANIYAFISSWRRSEPNKTKTEAGRELSFEGLCCVVGFIGYNVCTNCFASIADGFAILLGGNDRQQLDLSAGFCVIAFITYNFITNVYTVLSDSFIRLVGATESRDNLTFSAASCIAAFVLYNIGKNIRDFLQDCFTSNRIPKDTSAEQFSRRRSSSSLPGSFSEQNLSGDAAFTATFDTNIARGLVNAQALCPRATL